MTKTPSTMEPQGNYRQTAYVHIVISFMYLIDAVIVPFINEYAESIAITIALALNTMIALTTGIWGIKAATKHASIRLMKWYMILSVVCGVAAGLLIVVIVIVVISFMDTSEFNFSSIFLTYSVLSALFEISNSIVSVFVFRKRLDKLLHKEFKGIDDVTPSSRKEQGGDIYSTIEESKLAKDAYGKEPGKHMYEMTLQNTYNKIDEDTSHIYPNVIVKQEDNPKSVGYMEVQDGMMSHGEYKSTRTSQAYDYSYADVAPKPPPPRRPESVLNSPTSEDSVESKSDFERGESITFQNTDLYEKPDQRKVEEPERSHLVTISNTELYEKSRIE
ncbi:uncharacterized protein [Antedon mediterranea]|uniref:uncharacterized protein n=1 Tax=Antedon mediterranea TaxID=105859 RepID=UPI003AF44DF5